LRGGEPNIFTRYAIQMPEQMCKWIGLIMILLKCRVHLLVCLSKWDIWNGPVPPFGYTLR